MWIGSRNQIQEWRRRAQTLNPLGGFSPLDIPGLLLWLDFSDIATLFLDAAGLFPVTADGDVIGRVTDKSGNGNNVIQATTAKKPTYQVAEQNGLSVGRFDGIDDGLRRNSITLPTFMTIYVVAKFTLAKPIFIEHSANANANDGFYIHGSSNNMLNIRRNLSVHSVVGPANWMGASWAMIMGLYDGVHLVEKNTVAQANGAEAGSARANSDIAISFNIATRNQTTVFGDGDIGEMFIFDTPLSVANQVLINTFTNSKWAIF